MAVPVRDTAAGRLRRLLAHAVLGAAALVSAWAAASAVGRSSRAASEVDEARSALEGHREAADAVAGECGLRPFSGEADLETFPVELPVHPTRREMECARRVSVARADLIEDHSRIRRAAEEAGAARALARRRLSIAGLLALVLVVEVYGTEVRARSRAGGRVRGGAR
jgi:hypothetical protein